MALDEKYPWLIVQPLREDTADMLREMFGG